MEKMFNSINKIISGILIFGIGFQVPGYSAREVSTRVSGVLDSLTSDIQATRPGVSAPFFTGHERLKSLANWLNSFKPSDVKRFEESAAARSEARIHIRAGLVEKYSDVYTPEAITALEVLSHFNQDQKDVMKKRYERRNHRYENKERITFLDPNSYIQRTQIKVQDARDGKFVGSEIPQDLQRQWVQLTGPAARPREQFDTSARSVAYALLSSADGWMADGEDAAPHTEDASLDAQRNLKLAVAKDPAFLKVVKKVAEDSVKKGELPKELLENDGWIKQLDFTTKIFRARGLHLDDRHIRDAKGEAMSASIVDTVLYIVNNYRRLLDAGSTPTLYLPKIQTAEEAALWNDIISALEDHLAEVDPRVKRGMIKVYVLVEQVEATFQLMEIRAALGKHFVGFNTGRWDYINSVADAMGWDPEFVNSNIEEILMTYPYMAAYEDRVRRAVNTPDINGNFALWQGGMEANIPVGSPAAVEAAMAKAVKGAEREEQAGASGKWAAHWKMVVALRKAWKDKGQDNQLGRKFDPLTYTQADADALFALAPPVRTIRGARNLISVGLQYGNAFLRGYQAAALKPADFFGNDDILYLMEDMATGEIRLSILWEWLHKGGKLTADDPETGAKAGDIFTPELFNRLLEEEYQKLLAAKNKDVHDDSKKVTLPIALEIVKTYVGSETKAPWYIDLLNINLNVTSLKVAQERIQQYVSAFEKDGTRVTENLDFSKEDALDEESAEFKRRVVDTQKWMDDPRFKHITRLHTAVDVVRQQGDIVLEYPLAHRVAVGIYDIFRNLFKRKKQITSYGPETPNEIIAQKQAGIPVAYSGGWAASAAGWEDEDRGSDYASYPLSHVVRRTAWFIRGLLTADKNQAYDRSKMSKELREATPKVDYTPYIVMDADTGHGGDSANRNLVRRGIEVGVAAFHVEDQEPGCKKCGHQGGKVLSPLHEQITRLNAMRLQGDIMGVPITLVGRTDAEAATLSKTNSDERDHPSILGATNTSVPLYKLVVLTLLKRFFDSGFTTVNGHLKYGISDNEHRKANEWIRQQEGLNEFIEQAINDVDRKDVTEASLDFFLNAAAQKVAKAWEQSAGLMTYPKAVANEIEARLARGQTVTITVEEWLAFASRASNRDAREKARQYGIDVAWDWELPRTQEGFYQITGGIDMAIVHGLAMAPFADLLWMETKTPDLEEARHFAKAIHAVYPEQMLAYNLSPSFNWDAKGLTDEEMSLFNSQIGELGYVFNFITYAGHQFDALAGLDFARSLVKYGARALAYLQRKLRLAGSPAQFPQEYVGGNRTDAALVAAHGRKTVMTESMGGESTAKQHKKAVELPVKTLQDWLAIWAKENGFIDKPLTVELAPVIPGGDELMLNVFDKQLNRIAYIHFLPGERTVDRKKTILIKDQGTADAWRQKRLSTLLQLFLFARFKTDLIRYDYYTDANQASSHRLSSPEIGILVNPSQDTVGNIIAADVNIDRVRQLVTDEKAIHELITKTNGTAGESERSEMRERDRTQDVMSAMKLLQDPSRPARLSGVQTLGQIGSYAKAAVPVLKKRFFDSKQDLTTRLAIVETLSRIDPESTFTADLLQEVADNKRGFYEAELVSAAKNALHQVGPLVEAENTKRRHIVGGNWKMAVNTAQEAIKLLNEIAILLNTEDMKDVDVLIAPSTIHLHAVKGALNQMSTGRILLAAQDISEFAPGAHTTETSYAQLKDAGVTHVIIGHSEPRRGDEKKPLDERLTQSSKVVNAKVKQALAQGFVPIVAIGENQSERESERANAVVEQQLRESLAGLTVEQMKNVVLAYEPVWAIGTGLTATPEQANGIQRFIRGLLLKMFGLETAANTMIQYGGSMKPANAGELIAQPNVDGGLIGGAALKAEDFVAIIRAIAQSRSEARHKDQYLINVITDVAGQLALKYWEIDGVPDIHENLTKAVNAVSNFQDDEADRFLKQAEEGAKKLTQRILVDHMDVNGEVIPLQRAIGNFLMTLNSVYRSRYKARNDFTDEEILTAISEIVSGFGNFLIYEVIELKPSDKLEEMYDFDSVEFEEMERYIEKHFAITFDKKPSLNWKTVADVMSSVKQALANRSEARKTPDVETLIKNLQVSGTDNGRLRIQTAWELGKIGPQAESAIPALIGQVLRDLSWDARGTAAWALGEIGPGKRTVVTALKKASKKETHPLVQGSIERALEKTRTFTRKPRSEARGNLSKSLARITSQLEKERRVLYRSKFVYDIPEHVTAIKNVKKQLGHAINLSKQLQTRKDISLQDMVEFIEQLKAILEVLDPVSRSVKDAKYPWDAIHVYNTIFDIIHRSEARAQENIKGSYDENSNIATLEFGQEVIRADSKDKLIRELRAWQDKGLLPKGLVFIPTEFQPTTVHEDQFFILGESEEGAIVNWKEAEHLADVLNFVRSEARATKEFVNLTVHELKSKLPGLLNLVYQYDHDRPTAPILTWDGQDYVRRDIKNLINNVIKTIKQAPDWETARFNVKQFPGIVIIDSQPTYLLDQTVSLSQLPGILSKAFALVERMREKPFVLWNGTGGDGFGMQWILEKYKNYPKNAQIQVRVNRFGHIHVTNINPPDPESLVFGVLGDDITDGTDFYYRSEARSSQEAEQLVMDMVYAVADYQLWHDPTADDAQGFSEHFQPTKGKEEIVEREVMKDARIKFEKADAHVRSNLQIVETKRDLTTLETILSKIHILVDPANAQDVFDPSGVGVQKMTEYRDLVQSIIDRVKSDRSETRLPSNGAIGDIDQDVRVSSIASQSRAEARARIVTIKSIRTNLKEALVQLNRTKVDNVGDFAREIDTLLNQSLIFTQKSGTAFKARDFLDAENALQSVLDDLQEFEVGWESTRENKDRHFIAAEKRLIKAVERLHNLNLVVRSEARQTHEVTDEQIISVIEKAFGVQSGKLNLETSIASYFPTLEEIDLALAKTVSALEGQFRINLFSELQPERKSWATVGDLVHVVRRALNRSEAREERQPTVFDLVKQAAMDSFRIPEGRLVGATTVDQVINITQIIVASRIESVAEQVALPKAKAEAIKLGVPESRLFALNTVQKIAGVATNVIVSQLELIRDREGDAKLSEALRRINVHSIAEAERNISARILENLKTPEVRTAVDREIKNSFPVLAQHPTGYVISHTKNLVADALDEVRQKGVRSELRLSGSSSHPAPEPQPQINERKMALQSQIESTLSNLAAFVSANPSFRNTIESRQGYAVSLEKGTLFDPELLLSQKDEAGYLAIALAIRLLEGEAPIAAPVVNPTTGTIDPAMVNMLNEANKFLAGQNKKPILFADPDDDEPFTVDRAIQYLKLQGVDELHAVVGTNSSIATALLKLVPKSHVISEIQLKNLLGLNAQLAQFANELKKYYALAKSA